MSFSRGVGIERDFGALEHAHESVLVAQQALEQAVERGVSGLARSKMRSNRARRISAPLGARGELVFLQLAIEPPDHPPRDLDGLALLVVGGDQLVDEPFGVDPALRVHADAELAGAVRNDDEFAEPALLLNRAPQRAFAGHAHGVGRDRQLGQAELAQAPSIPHRRRKPRVARRRACRGRPGEGGRSHVDERGLIDHVARRPAQEVAQKRQPRLAWTRAKHGEAIGADVSGEAGLALMARAGVVDRDEREPPRPAVKTSSSSARNVSSLATNSRTTWRFEITTPAPFSNARIRSQVICP